MGLSIKPFKFEAGTAGGEAPEFRATLDQTVLRSLRTALPALGFLYLAYAASRATLDGAGFLSPIALINAVSAVAFFSLWILVARASVSARHAHPVLAVGLAVAVVNVLLHLYETSTPWHSTEVLLLFVGMGCLFLSKRWLTICTVAALGPAAIVVWVSRPPLEWPYYVATLLGASSLAFGVQAVRLRTFRTIHELHSRDEELQQELKKSQDRYTLALRGTNDGLWDWDLRSEDMYYSPRWKMLLGYEEHEISSSIEEWFKRVHPLDLSLLRSDLDAHVRRQTTQFSNEHRIRHKNGSYRWVLTRGLAVCDDKGRAIRLVGSQTDITRLKEVESRLMHDALHDRLTGLPNRSFFLSRLQEAIERQNRDGGFLFAVLFLDLDQFKVVNDSLGHHVGDRLLEEVGQRLLSCKAPMGTVARLGGDEFVMLIEDLRYPADVKKTAVEVQQVLAKPFPIDGHEVFTSASVGIALSIGRYERPEDLIRNADIAMYRAKCRGKGLFERFDWSMYSNAVNLWQRQRDLRHALDRGELFIHYQPTFSIQSGRITGAEALLRWQRPGGEVLTPKDFLPLAEDMGIIVPVGEWVLRTVCSQCRSWQQAGLPAVRVAVNLSPRQLRQQGFVKSLKRVLSETKLEPRWLELELTEAALKEMMDEAPTTLAALAEMGVRLSIDDFGAGSSSLSSLRRFCFDTLKISRAFVVDMLGDEKAAALVKGMIALSHSLNISVTATGVESREQLAFLLRERCDKIQGYLASRPVPPERFAELLLADRRLLPSQVSTPAPGHVSKLPAEQPTLTAVSEKSNTDTEDLAAVLSSTESVGVER